MKDCFDDPTPSTPDPALAEIFGSALHLLTGARLSNAPRTRAERIAWAQTLYDLRPDLNAETLLSAVRRHLTAQPAEDGARFWPSPSDLCAHMPPAALSDAAAWDRLYSHARRPMSLPAVDDTRTREEAIARIWESIVVRFDPIQREIAAKVKTYLDSRGLKFASLSDQQATEMRKMFIARCKQLRGTDIAQTPEIATRPERRLLPAPVETPEEDRVSAEDFATLRDRTLARGRAPRQPDPERAKVLRLVGPLSHAEQERHLADLRAHQQSRKGGE